MSIPDEWKFPGRDYPAAKDHINSLLNFGYYLLEQEIWAGEAWGGCSEAGDGVHHAGWLSRGSGQGWR